MSQVSDPKKLRYEDYVEFPDDGQRHEIIDGVHYVTPSPNTYHQVVSRRLQFLLYQAIELTGLGQVFDAPCDVELDEHDIVVPDLFVVLAENRIITPKKIKGSPDLIVEILSPSTRSRDLDEKRASYEANGVREYWIVDPDEHEMTQLVLADGKYAEREHDAVVRLSILEQVAVDFGEVW